MLSTLNGDFTHFGTLQVQAVLTLHGTRMHKFQLLCLVKYQQPLNNTIEISVIMTY